jgi:hypothetical protein
MVTQGKDRIMKKLILTMTLLTLAVGFTTAQKKPVQKETPIKQVQVTARTVETQPAGKAYVLDLNSKEKRTLYTIAAGTDYSRIQFRSSTGEMTVKDVVSRSGASGRLLVGTPRDMLSSGLKTLRMSSSAQSRGSGNKFIGCDGSICICTGDGDCNKMLSPGGDCPEGSYVFCWGSGETAACICVR